ncbi:bacteriocin immunity protein [Vibrio gazogenes]|uniref:Bacteriocin immunity protein n=1 Tax=Vibrio gazogenes TaxID=687 RepID=A0A1Z2SLK0_VIBGA|nr:bacteriocin immunity protein [Vibrio gazogenes]ASA58015.1 bacteriocin immunity protein [Vibrio gazogenes]
MGIEEYTETEFLKLVQDIISVKAGNEETHTKMVRMFCKLTEHPDGSDLIYYPDDPADATPERIVEIVKQWRASQGLPCFKD